MPMDSCRMASISLVSIYIQIMAKMDTNGKEAKKAPVNELRFEISEIMTINTEDMSSLIT